MTRARGMLRMMRDEGIAQDVTEECLRPLIERRPRSIRCSALEMTGSFLSEEASSRRKMATSGRHKSHGRHGDYRGLAKLLIGCIMWNEKLFYCKSLC
jgi:hypothetical protein